MSARKFRIGQIVTYRQINGSRMSRQVASTSSLHAFRRTPAASLNIGSRM